MDKTTFEFILWFIIHSDTTKIYFSGINYEHCYCTSKYVYFWNKRKYSPIYERFELVAEREYIYKFLRNATKVEPYFDGEYHTVYTKEDGLLLKP